MNNRTTTILHRGKPVKVECLGAFPCTMKVLQDDGNFKEVSFISNTYRNMEYRANGK